MDHIKGIYIVIFVNLLLRIIQCSKQSTYPVPRGYFWDENETSTCHHPQQKYGGSTVRGRPLSSACVELGPRAPRPVGRPVVPLRSQAVLGGPLWHRHSFLPCQRLVPGACSSVTDKCTRWAFGDAARWWSARSRTGWAGPAVGHTDRAVQDLLWWQWAAATGWL